MAAGNGWGDGHHNVFTRLHTKVTREVTHEVTHEGYTRKAARMVSVNGFNEMGR